MTLVVIVVARLLGLLIPSFVNKFEYFSTCFIDLNKKEYSFNVLLVRIWYRQSPVNNQTDKSKFMLRCRSLRGLM